MRKEIRVKYIPVDSFPVRFDSKGYRISPDIREEVVDYSDGTRQRIVKGGYIIEDSLPSDNLLKNF